MADHRKPVTSLGGVRGLIVKSDDRPSVDILGMDWMTRPTPEKAKIHALHGLRGLMAWWVVLGHISLAFGWHIPLIDQNTLAVDVFVLLSGFVIAMLIDRKAEPYGQYLARRAFRLFPLYIVVLAVSAALLPMQIEAWAAAPTTAANVNRLKLATNGLDHLTTHLLVHIPLLQGVFPRGVGPQAAYTIVGQAWSISLEWQFYVVAPLMMWAFANRRRWPLIVAGAAALLMISGHFTGAFLGAKIIHFMIGMVTYQILKRSDPFSWAVFVIALAIAALWKGGAMQIVPLGIWAAVIWSSAQPAHSNGHRIAAWIGRPAMFRMGEISYSIYLVHMIPLSVFIYAFRLEGLTLLTSQITVLIATLVVTYLISVLTFRFIEQPGIALGARLTARRENESK